MDLLVDFTDKQVLIRYNDLTEWVIIHSSTNNTLRPEPNGRQLAVDNFKYIALTEISWILLKFYWS